MTADGDPLRPETVRQLATDPGQFLSCDDCFRLADVFVERLLAAADEPVGPDTPAMRAHLAGCPACAEEVTSLLLLAAEDAGIDPAGALTRLRPA